MGTLALALVSAHGSYRVSFRGELAPFAGLAEQEAARAPGSGPETSREHAQT